MIPAVRHSGESRTAERVKRPAVARGLGGRGRMTAGEAQEIFEDGETVLCDTAKVNTWHYAFVKTHRKCNRERIVV